MYKLRSYVPFSSVARGIGDGYSSLPPPSLARRKKEKRRETRF